MLISLIGYMGSGKSTIGKELAEKLNFKFIDFDKYIENSENKTIVEIFKNGGEIKFRKIERNYLLKILGEETNSVIAMGGGTPVYYDNIEKINQYSASFYLRMTPTELYKRLLKEKNKRPLIARIENENLTEFIGKHLFERRNYYEKSKFKIDIKNKNVKQISEEIIQNLQRT